MSIISNFLRNTVLALVLGASAGLAVAAPSQTYEVTIDTSAFSGNGYLDLSFIPGWDTTPGASATLSHFSGAFGAMQSIDGDVSVGAGTLHFANTTGYNDAFQAITLGGTLRFDISFGGSFQSTMSDSSTTFGVGVLSADMAYLGNPDGNVAQFELLPINGGVPSSIQTSVSGNIATISAVPEAPEALMLVAGLAMLAFGARRRIGANA